MQAPQPLLPFPSSSSSSSHSTCLLLLCPLLPMKGAASPCRCGAAKGSRGLGAVGRPVPGQPTASRHTATSEPSAIKPVSTEPAAGSRLIAGGHTAYRPGRWASEGRTASKPASGAGQRHHPDPWGRHAEVAGGCHSSARCGAALLLQGGPRGRLESPSSSHPPPPCVFFSEVLVSLPGGRARTDVGSAPPDRQAYPLCFWARHLAKRVETMPTE